MKDMNKTKQEKKTSVTATMEPKRYEEGFKREAVEHWLRSGKSGTQIAKEMGISYPSLKEWKRRYGGGAEPQRSDLEAENRALVREQRVILKKTLGILSEAPRPATNASKP
jgi:transposase-like protein